MIASRYTLDNEGRPAIEISEDMFDIFDGHDISRTSFLVPLNVSSIASPITMPRSILAGMPQHIDSTDGGSPAQPFRAHDRRVLAAVQGTICFDIITFHALAQCYEHCAQQWVQTRM
ncbi:hypothetical protein DOTSEDRAFT_79879 [Dothistroma septosporum NZE10]|uniref:Uncharacterized protein n=1 Tax=Dothistroma septosporum (strain NZE10 / CBS 128990) TaxID=675120 RepID=N1PLR1_DOTSN|nr:hypothetical protein DOTSEDRAFT_79879 [Dothistroma septosporum NZE10]